MPWTLLKMRPTNAMNNFRHSSWVKPKALGNATQSLASLLTVAYLTHIVIGQFGVGMPFTALESATSSALAISVFVVLRDRSEKQMVRAYARWIVAAMKNLQRAVRRPEMDFIRRTRGFDVALRSDAAVDLAVSVFVASAQPKPTALSLANLRPESFRKRLDSCEFAAERGAKPLPSGVGQAGIYRKRRAAMQAIFSGMLGRVRVLGSHAKVVLSYRSRLNAALTRCVGPFCILPQMRLQGVV